MKANKTEICKLIKTSRGQLDGILKMIDDDRYCIDISNQLLAVQAILKKANKEIIKAHMQSCVNNAFETGEDSEQKINEIISMIDKLSK